MSHPSLVLWNGNNECVWLAELRDWRSVIGDLPYGRTWWEQDLPAIVGSADPGRPYWPGSPTSPAWTGAPPNSPDHGTMHIWDVWNERDYEAYREHRPRFAAEFGYQGPATWSTLERAVGRAELVIASPVLAHHQKATDGVAKLARGLEAALPGAGPTSMTGSTSPSSTRHVPSRSASVTSGPSVTSAAAPSSGSSTTAGR